MDDPDHLSYLLVDNVRLGESVRLKVHHFKLPPTDRPKVASEKPTKLYLELKNVLSPVYSARISGPFSLSVSVYNEHWKNAHGPAALADPNAEYDPCSGKGSGTALASEATSPNVPSNEETRAHGRTCNAPCNAFYKFKTNLVPHHTLVAELDERLFVDSTVTIDIVSQMLFSKNAPIRFRVTLSNSKHGAEAVVARHRRKKLTSIVDLGAHWRVDVQHSEDIWASSSSPSIPLYAPEPPRHLVVITHGLASNTYADMLYLRDAIETYCRNSGYPDDVCVRGFPGNRCNTFRGVRWLGKRVGQWMLQETQWPNPVYSRISMIGHSLGGPVQAFAAGYVHRKTNGEFFKRIQPVHLITLASPWLGVTFENPVYFKLALSCGIIWQTGRDLGLVQEPNIEYTMSPTAKTVRTKKPLLLLMSQPTSPVHQAIRMFQHRTVYSNLYNDGIVPLRTSCLLLLDYDSIRLNHRSLLHSSVTGSMRRSDAAAAAAVQEQSGASSSASSTRASEDVYEQHYNVLLNEIHSLRLSSETNCRYIDSHAYETVRQADEQVRRSEVNGVHVDMALEKRASKVKRKKRHRNVFCIRRRDRREGREWVHKRYNFFESTARVLVPKVPKANFLLTRHRENPVVHEKVYHPYEVKHLLQDTDSRWTERWTAMERLMATNWHCDMTWRKVVVNLQPDAHNNIVVRRLFNNAFGWPVIDHMVKTVFGENSRLMSSDCIYSTE
ncbi:serine esterase family protein [Schizosaccharomyces japonicus yFS275]|uniref:Serine esterase family protein n=1 Tax=Schizosaccharomyces japonicus (strain yFS275 / FY16936) TaxID=402676 RepID=B6K5X9_SCHJY|nr:serine esterase family protein [Schizosaccharomyces japonicus yFS275]EEB08933.1 serine esterase family protein [Schizosaccharomyces japonicus yFS275]